MRAHPDLQGGKPLGAMLPIHWATFNLAPHPWAEPGEGTLAAAQDAGARIALPRPGEPFEPTAQTVPSEPWWRAVAPQPLERRPGGAARITDLSADPGRGSEDAEAEAGHAEVAPTAWRRTDHPGNLQTARPSGTTGRPSRFVCSWVHFDRPFGCRPTRCQCGVIGRLCESSYQSGTDGGQVRQLPAALA